MSIQTAIRRADRAMSGEEAAEFLGRATVMRLGAVDADGWPYVVPLSFVYQGGRVYFHHTGGESRLTECLETDTRVCVEADEAGPAIAAGDTACGASRVYSSVIAFGRASRVTDPGEKRKIFDALMDKYLGPESRLRGLYPELEATPVFEIEIEGMTGKRHPGP